MQSTGKFFLIWALIIAGMMFGFNQFEGNIFNPNQSVQTVVTDAYTEVTLQRSHSGHYVASGEINGEDVIFFLDTGATDVAIPASLEDELGLVRGRSFPVNTANGRSVAFGTQLDSIRLGGIEMKNIDGAIVESMEGNTVLLGMSFLRHLDFSQRGETLILSTPR